MKKIAEKIAVNYWLIAILNIANIFQLVSWIVQFIRDINQHFFFSFNISEMLNITFWYNTIVMTIIGIMFIRANRKNAKLVDQSSEIKRIQMEMDDNKLHAKYNNYFSKMIGMMDSDGTEWIDKYLTKHFSKEEISRLKELHFFNINKDNPQK